jgi:hypothetical protein
MAAGSALNPVADAIFATLNVASLKSGLGLTVEVKDHVPQPAPFPFVLYELTERDISGLGDGTGTKQTDMRLRVYSQAQGMFEAYTIMTEAIRLLQFAEPTAVGWTIVKIGRPSDVIPISASEINGVACRELVSIWECIFADEQ